MCRKVSRGEHLPMGSASSSSTSWSISSTHQNTTTASTSRVNEAHTIINPIWRAKVTQWCYDYIDCIQERRNIVYIAMNLLDRYVQTFVHNRTMDHDTYQVATLSCTYLAIRIAGNKNLELNDLVLMSRGLTSEQDIIATGSDIVERLSWEERMETPTEYIHEYVSHHNHTSDQLDAAVFLAEVAVFDAQLAACAPQILAAAALLRVLPAASGAVVLSVLDDPKAVQSVSLRLGVFVEECLGNNEQRDDSNSIHVIEDDSSAKKRQSGNPSPVCVDGCTLIPDDDDDDDMHMDD